MICLKTILVSIVVNIFVSLMLSSWSLGPSKKALLSKVGLSKHFICVPTLPASAPKSSAMSHPILPWHRW